jgi:hypothetical protein
MLRICFRLGSCLLLCVGTLAVLPAREGPVEVKTKATAVQPANDPYVLAARIDELIAKQWEATQAVPAPPADDAEFMRRVYLDLTGRIPRVSEARAFLENKDPEKRRKLVNRLIDGEANVSTNANYVTHFTNTWRALLLPQSNDPNVQGLSPQLELWLRKRFKENAPYNRMVYEILMADPFAGQQVLQAQVEGPAVYGPNPGVFYQALENKPENLAAATSRLFLCVKVECAQCHDHPFAKWSQTQFWEYAAFFSGVQQQQQQNPNNPNGMGIDPKRRTIDIPGAKTKTTVTAKFMDGSGPSWNQDDITRKVLADWATSPQNPYFARATANRMWAHFFGIGNVEPVDEFSEENPPSHPELLDLLAKGLIDNNFDLKFLIRAITASRAYQLTSETTDKSQEDLRLFARMPIKGLTPEQQFDSLAVATNYTGELANRRNNTAFASARAEFLARFSNPVDKKTEHQTSILQALALMNGGFSSDAVDTDSFAVEFMFGRAAREEFSMHLLLTRTIGSLYDVPFMDTKARLDTLYLSTLSRPMRADESEKMVKYVETGGKRKDSRKALADVYWALLNSSEFSLNH